MMLSGKTALVTGAGQGIGRAIALALAAQGADVAVHYLHQADKAAETAARVEQLGRRSLLLPGDLTDSEVCATLVKHVCADWGRIDILVHVVGNFVLGRLEDISLAAWRDLQDSNCNSLFYVSRAVLPQMRTQQFGRIITFAAAGAEQLLTPAQSSAYYIAKTGVWLLTKRLAMDTAGSGISVNCISPGVVETSAVTPVSSRGKIVPIHEITTAVLELVSSENSTKTGHNITINHGWYPQE